MESYDATEQDVVIDTFKKMLWSVTKDGGKKRARGDKPEWWRDNSHEAAIFSHLNKWKHGEKVDKDSGVHPLVHLAWRALAIAYQETEGQVDPQKEKSHESNEGGYRRADGPYVCADPCCWLCGPRSLGRRGQ